MGTESRGGLAVEKWLAPEICANGTPIDKEEAQQAEDGDAQVHHQCDEDGDVASDEENPEDDTSDSSEDWPAELFEETWASMQRGSEASGAAMSADGNKDVRSSRAPSLTFEYEFEEELVDEFDNDLSEHGGGAESTSSASSVVPPSVTISQDGDRDAFGEGSLSIVLVPISNIYLKPLNGRSASRDVLQSAREHELKSRIWTSRAERAAEMAKATAHHELFGGDLFSNWLRKRKKLLWKHRWVVLKQNCIAYYRSPLSDTPLGVILFDSDMEVQEHENKGVRQLVISNKTRCSKFLSIKWRVTTPWRSRIMHALECSPYAQKPRFNSTFPERQQCYVRLLVDGQHGFECMAAAMAAAKSEIMICGWWMVLDLPLLRGDTQVDPPSSMRNLLLGAVARGVKVYIMLYQEVPVLVNDSFRVDQLLSDIPNIFVMRHPPPDDAVFFWSHHEKVLVVDREVAFVGGLDFTYNRWDTSSHCIWSQDSSVYFPGIDYRNPHIQDFGPSHIANPLQDILDRQADPRLPWHDVHCATYGPVVDDFVYHFVSRWDFTRRDNPLKYGNMPILLPKTEGMRMRTDGDLIEQIEQCGDNILKLPARLPCSCQLVRSLSAWSGGLAQPEKSIETAYVFTIQRAKHYVYIENQYFISATPNGVAQGENSLNEAADGGSNPNSDVPAVARNRVALALFMRISEAIRAGATFRAIIICPLVPDMHSDVVNNVAMRTVVHYEISTIRWLVNSLKTAHPTTDIDQYLSVHCLHQYQVLPSGAILHGAIYVHSKVMIVDDQTILVGSANINDRSMTGTRDSETVLVIEDHSYINSTMNGEPYRAGANAHSLRLRLWLEHLGHVGDEPCGGHPETLVAQSKLSMDVVQSLSDPIHDDTYLHIWKHTSAVNTLAYTAAFPTFPSNEIKTLSSMNERLRDTEGTSVGPTKRHDIIDYLQVVQGHLVDYPVEFLIDSDLSPPLTSAENLLPSYVFA